MHAGPELVVHFLIIFQCDPTETTVGEIAISLPRPSKVREYQVDVAMEERCHTGMAVYCRQMCGIGPHLVQMLSHVKYKAENDQVRIFTVVMQTCIGMYHM